MQRAKLKKRIHHYRYRFEIGDELEWVLDEDVNFYNIKYKDEIILSLKPENFFDYFETVAEKRRKKLTRVLNENT